MENDKSGEVVERKTANDFLTFLTNECKKLEQYSTSGFAGNFFYGKNPGKINHLSSLKERLKSIDADLNLTGLMLYALTQVAECHRDMLLYNANPHRSGEHGASKILFKLLKAIIDFDSVSYHSRNGVNETISRELSVLVSNTWGNETNRAKCTSYIKQIIPEYADGCNDDMHTFPLFLMAILWRQVP